MSRIDQLLTLAAAYGRAEGIELSTVSSRIFDDGKKLTALRDGGDIQVRRCDRAIDWLSDHWPASLKWPAGIPRPSAKARSAAR